MFAAECVIECDKSDGSKCQPGDIILHRDAWMLCLPGFRNEPPRFKPADDDTQAKVDAELARRKPIVDQTMQDLQRRINAYAESGRFKIDPATGFFKRDAQGMLVGKMSKLELHVMETAAGYDLQPQVPEAPAKPEKTAAKPDAA